MSVDSASRLGGLVRRRLVHTCTLTPQVVGTANVDNQPGPTLGTPVTGVKCRFIRRGSKEVVEGLEAGVQRFAARLLLPGTAAVAAETRVSAIHNRDGSEAEPGTYVVKEVAGPQLASGKPYQTAVIVRLA